MLYLLVESARRKNLYVLVFFTDKKTTFAPKNIEVV